jgi:hypothetical protein
MINFKLATPPLQMDENIVCSSHTAHNPDVPRLWPMRGTAGPLGGASCLFKGHTLNEIWAQNKIYILIGTLLG